MTASTLRERSESADILADGAWHAWWTESGVTLAAYLGPMIQGKGIPFGLVTHEGDLPGLRPGDRE